MMMFSSLFNTSAFVQKSVTAEILITQTTERKHTNKNSKMEKEK